MARRRKQLTFASSVVALLLPVLAGVVGQTGMYDALVDNFIVKIVNRIIIGN